MCTAFCTTTSKRFVVPLLGVALLSCFACAQANAQGTTPAQELEDLAAATSLVRDGIKPWHLRLTFIVNTTDGKQLDTGTADVRWTARDHETVQVASTVFHGDLPGEDAAFAAGTLRELYLLRQLIEQTSRPVELPHDGTDLTTSEQMQKFGKVEFHCLTMSNGKAPTSPVPKPWRTQFCTSAPGVLRARLEPGLEIVRNRLATFQKVSVALDNTISYSGQVAITGHVEVLETIPADWVESTPPPTQRSPQPILGMMLAGRKIKGDTPQYPFTDRDRRISGSVVLLAVINKAGQIKDLTEVGSPDSWLRDSAMKAVKTWTYAPYVMDGAVTETITTITVNYNLAPI